MNYVEHLNLFGVEAKQIPCSTGSGAPTTSTEGAVGCFYMDTVTGDIYKCVGADGDKYVWYSCNESNTELVDIRTGYDDTVYETAGEAVREQIKQIKADVDARFNLEDEEIELTFAQYGNYRLRAILTQPIPEHYMLEWNDEEYSVGVTFKDTLDGTEVKDTGWNLPSPIDISSAYSGEYSAVLILIAKGKPSKDGNINISINDDLPLANMRLYRKNNNELSRIIDDISGLEEEFDIFSSDASRRIRDIEKHNLQTASYGTKRCGTTLIAHGGFTYLYPENTIVSLAGAKKYGFKYCECDVRVTLDEEFVLMHDTMVDRTTNGSGLVSEMTLEQIKALNIDFWGETGTTGEEWYGLTVPTLDEYLANCVRLDIIPVIEVRDFTENQLDKLMGIIRKYNLEDVSFIISFYKDICTYLRSISNVRLAPIISLTQENIDYCAELGNAGIHIDAATSIPDPELMMYAIDMGVEVSAWTVNLPDRAMELERLGVKYITTDRLIYSNDFSKVYTSEYRIVEDNLDGTMDNWGFVMYEKDFDAVPYKDLVRVYAEVFYTQDKPTMQIGAVPFELEDKPNEWQVVDFTAPAQVSVNITINMKDKVGVAYYKNVRVMLLKV